MSNSNETTAAGATEATPKEAAVQAMETAAAVGAPDETISAAQESSKDSAATSEVVADTTEAAKKEDAPAPKFDDKMKAYAKAYGFEDEDLEAFENPEQLRRAILAQERRDAARAEASKATTTAKQPENKPQVERVVSNDFEPTPRYTFKEEDWESPEVAKVLNAREEHWAGLVDQLRQDFSAAINDIRQGVDQRFDIHAGRGRIRELDYYVEKLGDDWKEKFGAGDTMKIDKRTTEFKARQALFNDANKAYLEAERAGLDPDFSEILERSRWKLYGDKIKAEAAKEIHREIEERVNMRSTPPGSDVAPRKELSARESAILEMKKTAGLV